MRHLLLICLFLSISISLIAQTAQSVTNLKTTIKSVNSYSGMKSGSWTFCVLDAKTGRLIAEFNKDKALATASTMKAVTTSTALAKLGENYTYRTVLEHDGTVTNGVLRGNLYIKGSGDPSLGSDRFGEAYSMENILLTWVDKIKEKGITRIEGKIIGDARAFATQITPPKWTWEDIGNYYGAGACGLIMNENKYRLDLVPGKKVGDPTTVMRTLPEVDVKFVNEIKTAGAGTGDNAYIYGVPYMDVRYLRGTIPAGRSVFSIKGSIPDPAVFCAKSLMDKLQTCGVSVGGGYSSIRKEMIEGRYSYSNRSRIYTHVSPPLKDIVYWTNLKSVNIFAEALLNTIGKEKHADGSTEGGLYAIDSHWKGKGVDTKGMLIRDGSGLSPNNAMSSYHLASILAKTYNASYFQSFYNSLPIAAQSGSLKNICQGTAAAGKVRAKSGYLSGVRGYAGYAKTKSGQMLAFAVMVNNYTGSPFSMKKQLAKLMVSMAAMR